MGEKVGRVEGEEQYHKVLCEEKISVFNKGGKSQNNI